MNPAAPDSHLLDVLRGRVIAEPALLSRLWRLSSREDVTAALATIAGEPTDWLRMLQTGAADEAGAFPWRLDGPPPADWLPVSIEIVDGEPFIDWLPIDLMRAAEPFYRQSADRAQAHLLGAVLRCRTPAAILAELAAAPGPSALVFHVSRCGSTLVGRMLDAAPETLVASEPWPLDLAIRLWLHGAFPADWVRGMAAALVRSAHPDIRHRVIKLDAWHSLSLGRIADLFPRSRKLFLFRDPVEVLVSQRRAPGSHCVPGELPLATYGLTRALPAEPDAFAAGVIGEIMQCGAALPLRADMLFCDYADLPAAVPGKIAAHFGIAASASDRAAMETASRAYSKDPGRIHVADREAKQAEADAGTRTLVHDLGLDRTYGILRARANSQRVSGTPMIPGAGEPPKPSITIRYSGPFAP